MRCQINTEKFDNNSNRKRKLWNLSATIWIYAAHTYTFYAYDDFFLVQRMHTYSNVCSSFRFHNSMYDATKHSCDNRSRARPTDLERNSMCYLCNVVRLLFRVEYGIKCRRLKANVCNVIYGREYSKFMIIIILSAANVSKLTEVRERQSSILYLTYCFAEAARKSYEKNIKEPRTHTHTQDNEAKRKWEFSIAAITIKSLSAYETGDTRAT